MPPPTDPDNTEVAPNGQPQGRLAVLNRHRWVTFVLPFLVFMLITSLEPTREVPGGGMLGLAIPFDCYPLVYVLKIGLTIAAMVFVWPGYGEFPFRIGRLAVLVGVVGIVVWVGLCSLDFDGLFWIDAEGTFLRALLEPIGMERLIDAGARSQYNPVVELAAWPVLAYGFLAIRFVGLVLVVSVVEEFFLRGFVLRFVIRNDWWNVPIGRVTKTSAVVTTLAAMATHPTELLAAAVWFSMVTWLYAKTRNIWDCVAAHAITNLLLGIYVVSTDQWRLM